MLLFKAAFFYDVDFSCEIVKALYIPNNNDRTAAEVQDRKVFALSATTSDAKVV